MALNNHSTCYPGIFFGGGDLFHPDFLSNFDGVLAFVYGGFSPLHSDAILAKIPYPNVLYGAEHNSGYHKPRLREIPNKVWVGLDRLTSNGCRNIGFHGAEVSDGYYVDGARICLRSICEWIERNPGRLDRVTLVDLNDDYYQRFGEAGFLLKRGIVTVGPENQFEEYFESVFQNGLSNLVILLESADYQYHPYVAMSDQFRWSVTDSIFNEDPLFSSVSAFYISLIPQVIAKVTGKMTAMYAFSRCAQWPLVLCGLGGHMSPYEIMRETDALPSDDMKKEWAEIADREVDYFSGIAKSIILSYLWNPDPTAYMDLREQSQQYIDRIVSEIRSEVSCYVSFFLGGSKPANYYIEEQSLEM